MTEWVELSYGDEIYYEDNEGHSGILVVEGFDQGNVYGTFIFDVFDLDIFIGEEQLKKSTPKVEMENDIVL